jgi:hypothetical protein
MNSNRYVIDDNFIVSKFEILFSYIDEKTSIMTDLFNILIIKNTDLVRKLTNDKNIEFICFNNLDYDIFSYFGKAIMKDNVDIALDKTRVLINPPVGTKGVSIYTTPISGFDQCLYVWSTGQLFVVDSEKMIDTNMPKYNIIVPSLRKIQNMNYIRDCLDVCENKCEDLSSNRDIIGNKKVMLDLLMQVLNRYESVNITIELYNQIKDLLFEIRSFRPFLLSSEDYTLGNMYNNSLTLISNRIGVNGVTMIDGMFPNLTTE